MPRLRARATVPSLLASSTRSTSSTTSRGISRQVFSSVRSALYAGSTTTTFLPGSTKLVFLGHVHESTLDTVVKNARNHQGGQHACRRGQKQIGLDASQPQKRRQALDGDDHRQMHQIQAIAHFSAP